MSNGILLIRRVGQDIREILSHSPGKWTGGFANGFDGSPDLPVEAAQDGLLAGKLCATAAGLATGGIDIGGIGGGAFVDFLWADRHLLYWHSRTCSCHQLIHIEGRGLLGVVVITTAAAHLDYNGLILLLGQQFRPGILAH